MKKTICFSLVAFLIMLGCSKSDEFTVNPDENQLKSARTASPITPWGKKLPGVWDDNAGVLRTSLWFPPALGALPDYSFTQYPEYDFSPYYINGETEYNPAYYDVMTHFGYISPEAVTGAVVEFIFPHIKYFLPHMNGPNQQRIYTVNNVINPTVITCTTDLVKGMNPMFCFLVKVDCGKGERTYTTFWTDMKVNGVSVKGTIGNKVFASN
jgi:hypothetical protein